MEKDTHNFLYTTNRNTQMLKDKPYKLRLRNWLNIIFMLLAVATVLLYFLCPEPERILAVFTTGCIAVIVKTAEVTIRMTRKHTRK